MLGLGFFSFAWSIPGAVLSVPTLVVIRLACGVVNHPGARWITAAISGHWAGGHKKHNSVGAGDLEMQKLVAADGNKAE